MPIHRLTILHTNDFHGRLTPERVAFIQSHRRENDLYVDCGDAIKAGNLAIPLRPEMAWERLAEAGCDVSTLGNRESHPLESAFEAKLRGIRHPVVVANLRHKKNGLVFPPSIALERNGLRIGVLGVMVPIVTERMATQSASAYLWDPPIPTAIAEAQRLRGQVDLVIALTHIGYAQDRQLAEACPEIDLILGGHSHTVLSSPERHGHAWVAQTGSHGRFLGRYVWDGESLTGELIPMPA